MKPGYLIAAKVVATVLLGLGSIAAIVLALISLPVDSVTTNVWAGIFLFSAAVGVTGVVQCWRHPGLSNVTLAGLVYAACLFGYLNWLAPGLPEPMGLGSDNAQQFDQAAPQAQRHSR